MEWEYDGSEEDSGKTKADELDTNLELLVEDSLRKLKVNRDRKHRFKFDFNRLQAPLLVGYLICNVYHIKG